MQTDNKVCILGVVIIIILTFWLAIGNCATYYVRADGTAIDKESTSSCSGASSTMNVTVHNAETFIAEDIIKLCSEGGDFTSPLSIPSSGTSDNDIVYKNGSGTFPVIDATNNNSGITFNLKNYITIKNVWIKNALLYGVLLNGTNNTIINVVIIDSIDKGVFVNNTSGKIYNSVIYGSAGIGIDVNENCAIKNTIVRNSTGADIDITTGKTVTGITNMFDDAAITGSGTYTDTGTQWSTDPLFIAENDDNFRLTNSSPAINTGTNLGENYDDTWNPIDYISDIPSTTVLQGDYGAGWEIGVFAHTGDNSASGVVLDWNQKVISGIESYIFLFDLTGTGNTIQLANSPYVGSCKSDVNGAWSIPNGFDSATEYLVTYQYYGTYKGYTNLAGAEFKTLGGN